MNCVGAIFGVFFLKLVLLFAMVNWFYRCHICLRLFVYDCRATFGDAITDSVDVRYLFVFPCLRCYTWTWRDVVDDCVDVVYFGDLYFTVMSFTMILFILLAIQASPSV